jgi:hypothetical protein
MHYEANAASIPLELYTTTGTLGKLEAVIFYDWVSPVPTAASLGQSMTITFTPQ